MGAGTELEELDDGKRLERVATNYVGISNKLGCVHNMATAADRQQLECRLKFHHDYTEAATDWQRPERQRLGCQTE